MRAISFFILAALTLTLCIKEFTVVFRDAKNNGYFWKHIFSNDRFWLDTVLLCYGLLAIGWGINS